MSLFNVGRLAVKIAGRDAGRKCVVVEQIDDNYVVVDGNVRRKKVNIKHLEPLAETIELKDKASHEEVKKTFESLGIPVWEKKSKKPAERPKKQKKIKEKPAEEKGKDKKKKAEKADEKAKEQVEEKQEFKETEEKSVEEVIKKEANGESADEKKEE